MGTTITLTPRSGVFENKLAKRRMKADATRRLRIYAKRFAENAKIFAVVRTGIMKGSIEAEKVGDLHWRVATHTKRDRANRIGAVGLRRAYGRFVETGEGRGPAQPFMAPAAQMTKKQGFKDG